MKRYSLISENINTTEDLASAKKALDKAYLENKLSKENYNSLLLEIANLNNELFVINENRIEVINNLNIIVPNESNRNQGSADNTYFKVYRGKIKNLRKDPCLRISLIEPIYAGDNENSRHECTDKKKLDQNEKEQLVAFFNLPFTVPTEENSPTKVNEYNQMKDQLLKEKYNMKIHRQDISYIPDVPTNWIATLFYYNILNYNQYTASVMFPLTTKMPDYLTL